MFEQARAVYRMAVELWTLTYRAGSELLREIKNLSSASGVIIKQK